VVGREHGTDGAFWVERLEHPLEVGTRVTLAGREVEVVSLRGTAGRPLVKVSGVDDRQGAGALRGEALLVPLDEAPLAEGEWLVDDLVGCSVEGIGEVRRVLAGPSCDVLEVGEEAVLVPLVRDAVRSVDLDSRTIEIDRDFLGLP
jgi:16S rRNA processing protein RimM